MLHKQQSDVVIVIFHFALFIPLLPTDNPKNQNFEKMKKRNTWRYHPFTQVYQKPWSYAIQFLIWHTMDAIVIFHFGLFLSFYPQTVQKMKIWHKWKIFLEMSSFYKSAPKIIIPFINFIFDFRLFLPFPHFISKKENFKKMKTMSRGIIIFYKCTKKPDYMLVLFFAFLPP